MSSAGKSQVLRTNAMYRFNSTFKFKAAKPMKRSAIKRSGRPMKKISVKAKRLAPAYVRWQREVRTRDDFTCQFPGCGHYSKQIDVHHIAKRSQRPDLKFTVSIGVCLCREHLDWTDTHHDEAVHLSLLNTESYELAKRQERKAA